MFHDGSFGRALRSSRPRENAQTRFRQEPLENAVPRTWRGTDGPIHALCKASVLKNHAQVTPLSKKQQLDQQHYHASHQHNKQQNKEENNDHAKGTTEQDQIKKEYANDDYQNKNRGYDQIIYVNGTVSKDRIRNVNSERSEEYDQITKEERQYIAHLYMGNCTTTCNGYASTAYCYDSRGWGEIPSLMIKVVCMKTLTET